MFRFFYSNAGILVPFLFLTFSFIYLVMIVGTTSRKSSLDTATMSSHKGFKCKDHDSRLEAMMPGNV